MEGHYEELSGAEKALAAARARGDFVINSALDWIDRFHSQCKPDLIQRLTQGIRSLSRAMHSRSADEIVAAVDELLDTHERLLLPGGGAQAPPVSGLAVPRVHEEWSQSEYFAPEQHEDRRPEQVRGPVFVSYARADSEWLSRVQVHLRPLERAGRIELWHDGKLQTGDPWREELDRIVRMASSAILLVSANFMASDFIYANELQPIAKRAKDGGVVVFPVFVGHCLFDEDDYLRDFQSFNDPEKPLTRLDPTDVDKVLVDLAKAVRRLAGDVQANHNGR